ncbi:MAG: hypothetical protein V1725_07295 [archaeon]
MGWVHGNTAYIVSKATCKKESKHGFTDEEYGCLLKHELTHLFFQVAAKGNNKPVWLWEGVALYVSGETTTKKRPASFKEFLNSYDLHCPGVYEESGFVVRLLVKRYGQAKLLWLITDLQHCKSKAEFSALFKNTYGFAASYKSMNKLLVQKQSDAFSTCSPQTLV